MIIILLEFFAKGNRNSDTIVAMKVNKPEDKKTLFNKQLKVEKGKTKATRCIYSADALCFAPEKRYKLCDECPRIKRGKKKGPEDLFKNIVGNAINMLGKDSPPPPPHSDLKL